MFHDGKIVSYEMPKTVDLVVKDTPPSIKGATATNQMKDAEIGDGADKPRAGVYRDRGKRSDQQRDRRILEPGVI